MTDIRIGEVAFIQTSQEPVFVLDIKEGTSLQRYPALSGQVATVRRPTEGTESGVRHTIEFYSIEELETLEARQTRQIREIESMQERYTNATRKTSVSSELPSIN